MYICLYLQLPRRDLLQSLAPPPVLYIAHDCGSWWSLVGKPLPEHEQPLDPSFSVRVSVCLFFLHFLIPQSSQIPDAWMAERDGGNDGIIL